jgi:hypothetical protein
LFEKLLNPNVVPLFFFLTLENYCDKLLFHEAAVYKVSFACDSDNVFLSAGYSVLENCEILKQNQIICLCSIDFSVSHTLVIHVI